MGGSPPPSPRRTRGAHESKSATVRAAAAAPSRRQLSRWEREQRQQRLLYLGAGGLVLVVLLIFGAGLLYDNVLRANESVAQVGSQTITAGQLLDEVKVEARSIDAQAKQAAQAGGGASASSLSQYVDSQKRQLPDQAMNDLLDATIIQQEADRRGISVSQAEIDDRMQQVAASYQASSNPTPTAEASPSASASPSPSPSTGTPTPLPTLPPAEYQTALQKFLDQTGLTEQDERKQVSRAILREKVLDAVGQDQVPATQDQVHAREIVLPSEDQAREVLNQLQAGADFATLAQQDSTDAATKASGGDLGWFARGQKAKEIEDAAFSLQPGQFSDVIPSGASFVVLQLLEHDPNRAVPPDQLATQRQQAASTWLSQQRAGPDVRLNFTPSQRDWILSKIGVRP